jgi:hypothetical protein
MLPTICSTTAKAGCHKNVYLYGVAQVCDARMPGFVPRLVTKKKTGLKKPVFAKE